MCKTKRAANFSGPFFEVQYADYRTLDVALIALICVAWNLLRVVLNEIELLAMAVTRVEVKLLHLGVDLVIAPVIVVEPVNRTHHSGAMSSACAMDIKLAGGRIVGDF